MRHKAAAKSKSKPMHEAARASAMPYFKVGLLSSAKGFLLNSFDLLPSVGVLQLISNNLWPCESFDDLHKQCYLPITGGEAKDSKD